MFVFLDLLERVVKRFRREEVIFKHHVLINKYISEKGRVSLKMEWTKGSFVYVEREEKVSHLLKYPHFLSNIPAFFVFDTRIIPAENVPA